MPQRAKTALRQADMARDRVESLGEPQRALVIVFSGVSVVRLADITTLVFSLPPSCRNKKRDAAAKKEVEDLREAMKHVSESAKGLAKQRDDARAALARAKGTLRRMAPVRLWLVVVGAAISRVGGCLAERPE